MSASCQQTYGGSAIACETEDYPPTNYYLKHPRRDVIRTELLGFASYNGPRATISLFR
jgi:hypothetical protein